MGDKLLAVEDLRRTFDERAAVAGICLTVTEGEMLAIIGPNGAGKSTLFNLIGGQLRPDSGQVRLAGRNVTGMSARRAARLGVGRTFQITATFGSMTVRENVQLALLAAHQQVWRVWRPVRDQHRAEAEALLDDVHLTAQANRFAAVLAYGDLKRLELAMALAGAPRLLLMDEPTAGMAPAERVALMQLTRRLATERKLGVLFTEHDMDVVFSTADRVAVLHEGRLIAHGAPAEVRADPLVREVYLGEAADGG